MKGLVLPAVKAEVEVQNLPKPSPAPDEVLVKLKAASLNRRDYWITQGLYPKIVTPVILGSDGAGTIESIGTEHLKWKPDDEVVIYPATNWGSRESAQSDDFKVLGMPENGTFAEYVKINTEQLFPKPTHLSWAETASIPVAGITAYRAAMVQGQLRPGQTVLITGIGGGVAVFALQLALASKATVYVTSSKESKIERAKKLGAKAGFLYTNPNWSKECLKEAGPIDLIIDGAGGKGYNDLISLLKPGGHLVNYGFTGGKPENLDLFKIFWRQLHLVGSTLGSPADFGNLLQFMAEHQLKPIVDLNLPLNEGPEAIAKMRDSEQFGKIALQIN